MAAKPKAPPEAYNVCSAITGAQVVIGVPLGDASTPGTAVYECARLNAEARVNTGRVSEAWPQGEPHGLQAGVITTYEVVSASGIVVS